MRLNPDLADALNVAEDTAQGLVHVRDLRAAGIRDNAVLRARRAGHLVRVRRGVYARQALERLPSFLVQEGVLSPLLVRAVRALLMSWGAHCAARGRTAALLRGWALLEEPRKHEIAVQHGQSRRRAKGLLVREVRRLERDAVVAVPGTVPVPVLPAWQVVLEALRSLPPIEAIVLADSALRSKDVTLADLVRRAQSLPGVRQAAHVRRLLEWCDPLSGSVLESVLRYRLHQAGITGFRTQVVVSRDGKHVLRTDFCFEQARLVVEVDGARWHQDTQKDRSTDNQLVAVGYRVLRFGWSEVVDEPGRVLALIREALAAAGTGCCHLTEPGSLCA